MTMEEAIEDLARALDRLCDVVDDSECMRLAMGINVIELQRAEETRNKYFILGYISGTIQAVPRMSGDVADTKMYEALKALHRVREIVIKEEEEEEPDIDVSLHFKDGTVVKAYTDEDGRMIFKPQGKGAKKDE